MTIKELCSKYESCRTCPYYYACQVLYFNAPYGYDGDDDKAITKSIIETAKILESTNTEQLIRENLKSLTTYRVPNSNTDLVSFKAVERVLNLVFRGNRESEV